MSHPRRQRSEYLKNGCKECKRRKIKCDEFQDPPQGAVRKINSQGRDLCWQCTRLKKDCEYPMKGEKVARVSRKVLLQEQNGIHTPHLHPHQPHGLGPPHPINSGHSLNRSSASGLSSGSQSVPPQPGFFRNSQIRYQLTIGSLLNDAEHLPVLPYFNGPPHFEMYGPHPPGHPLAPLNVGYSRFPPALPVSGSPPGSVSVSSVSGPAPPAPMLLGPDGIHSYDHSDLTLLAADLNNLVSDMMFDASFDPKGIDETHPTPPTPTSDGSSEGKALNFNDWIPRNIGLDSIDLRKPEERVLLQEFYLEFADIILPFNAYDRALQCYFNPVRDILLRCASKEPFLLAAVLAQGARSAFLKNGVAEDEEAYYMYLLRCLKLLGPALGDASEKDGLALISNIEAVLLTVLLLTSSNAANAKQNWRPHLKGAKDLLLKHTTNRSHTRNSKVLIFCKYWFVSFEILAGLGLKLGGTVKLDAELDLLLNFQDPYECQVLTELGLVLPNGFNLLGGYHNECIDHLRDLIKLLNRVRTNGKSHTPSDSTEYIRLLSEFHKQRNVEFVNKKCFMDAQEFAGGIFPPGLLLDPIAVGPKRIVISWMDTSQQLYSLAATITIMTDFFQMRYDSPQVQDLTSRLTSLLSFLSHLTETPLLNRCSLMMIQWPIVVAGTNLMKESDKCLVTNLFQAAAKIGAGSAGHSLNRMQRIWRNHDVGTVESEDESHVDVVTY